MPTSGGIFDNPGRRIGLAFALVLLTGLLLAVGAFEPVENRLTNLRAKLLDRAPSGQTVVVEIDAHSLSKLRTWPWSRRYHAEAVRQLHAQGADLIAFDVDFSALSEPEGDRAFAEALANSQTVILPIFQQRASDRSGDRVIIENRPAPLFRSAWVGGVNILPEKDGIVRDYPAAMFIEGAIQPSIAALLADSHQLGDRRFQPDWSIDVNRIPRFSFVDVIEGNVPDAAFRGKRVLIGATAIELGDRYTVPRFGNIPGVVIQTLAAESLLQERAIMRSGAMPTMLGVTLVALLLCAGRFRRFGPGVGLVSVACLVVLVTAPIIIQIYWPVSVDSAAMLFVALAGIGLRGAAEIQRHVASKSLQDAETQLPNRMMLEANLHAEGPTQTGSILTVASIDRFDVIRDAIGIDAVNRLVRDSASRIEANIDSQIYRIAPDTLAWVQPDVPDVTIDLRIAAVNMAFRQAVDTSHGKVDVALTIGLDRANADITPMLRIERAISAVGAARDAHRKYQWYSAANPATRRQLSMMSDLRQGLDNGEVHLAYQPKLNLKRNTITDAETLMRWKHPADGFISPDLFIPLAESTGVVGELTEFALHGALADCARWRNNGVSMRVAVNISAADLTGFEFVAKVERLLALHGVKPSALALEITESAVIQSSAIAISVLGALRDLGIRLSIDDYGTGQSTLSYLKELPVHELKIDKSFITTLCKDQSNAIMVRSTINLAHELGLMVVAEGIEDMATLGLLRSLGCDYAQGYFISRPVSFSALTELLSVRSAQQRKTA